MASFAIADQVKDTNTVNDHAKLLSNGLPQPPIPQRLREMLKDYPRHLERLQAELDHYVTHPTRSMLFDGAIWALEGQLEEFIREAKDELEVAQASGDAVAITQAEEKVSLMRRARSSNVGMRGLHVLRDYLEMHKELLK